MPIHARRKVLRSAKDSNWTSAIPSVYSLSSLGLDTPYLATPADSKIASFYKYVEGQRLQRGLQGPRSLKYMAMELLIRNLSELDDLNDLPKHLIKCLWNMLKRRYVGSSLSVSMLDHKRQAMLLWFQFDLYFLFLTACLRFQKPLVLEYLQLLIFLKLSH